MENIGKQIILKKSKQDNNFMELDPVKSKVIEAHEELIEILEKLRKKVDAFSYGALNHNLSYRELTCLLAKKINMKGGII